MSGSSAASDVALRRKLEAQLLEAKEGLNDTYYDHAQDQQSQALDDEAEAFRESKEKYLEELEATLDDVETLITNSIMEVMLNADTVLEQLNEISNKYGVTLSTELTKPWADAAAKPAEYWQNAKDSIADYSDFLTSAELGNGFEKTITGFGTQIQSLVTYWDQVKAAAEAAHAEQERKVTVGGNPNIDDSNGNNGGDGNPPGGNKAKTISKETRVDMIPHYLDSAGNVYYKVQGMTDAYVPKSATVNKSGILWAKKGVLYYSLAEKKLKKKAYSSNTSGGGGGKFSQAMMYAKGTMGTTEDQWAITDEPWLGDELTMYATPEGKLSYMRSGSTVVPADITANLVEWGKLNPDMMKVGGGANLNMISNAVNKPEFNFAFDSLVHVDHCDEGTLKDLEKMVDNKINQFNKQLNYSLKKFTR